MTAAQVAAYPYPQELPELAQSPDVQVRFDLDELHYAPELCGVCEQAVGGPVRDSVMAISYRFRLDIEPSRVGICSVDHADRELDDLLHHLCQTPAEVVLHLSATSPAPAEPAETPPVHNFEALLHGLRNTARQGEAWDAVEAFRKAAIEAVSRIDTERRAAA